MPLCEALRSAYGAVLAHSGSPAHAAGAGTAGLIGGAVLVAAAAAAAALTLRAAARGTRRGGAAAPELRHLLWGVRPPQRAATSPLAALGLGLTRRERIEALINSELARHSDNRRRGSAPASPAHAHAAAPLLLSHAGGLQRVGSFHRVGSGTHLDDGTAPTWGGGG